MTGHLHLGVALDGYGWHPEAWRREGKHHKQIDLAVHFSGVNNTTVWSSPNRAAKRRPARIGHRRHQSRAIRRHRGADR